MGADITEPCVQNSSRISSSPGASLRILSCDFGDMIYTVSYNDRILYYFVAQVSRREGKMQGTILYVNKFINSIVVLTFAEVMSIAKVLIDNRWIGKTLLQCC